jgi:hypothetical protein
VTFHRYGEVSSKWRSLIPSVKLLLFLGTATPGHLKPPYSGAGSGPPFGHDLSLGRLDQEGARVRSAIRTRSQPWPLRSAASCPLLNADTARLTV